MTEHTLSPAAAGVWAEIKPLILELLRTGGSTGPSPAELRLKAGYTTLEALAAATGLHRAMLRRYEAKGSKMPGARGLDLTRVDAALGVAPGTYKAAVRRLWENRQISS